MDISHPREGTEWVAVYESMDYSYRDTDFGFYRYYLKPLLWMRLIIQRKNLFEKKEAQNYMLGHFDTYISNPKKFEKDESNWKKKAKQKNGRAEVKKKNVSRHVNCVECY